MVEPTSHHLQGNQTNQNNSSRFKDGCVDRALKLVTSALLNTFQENPTKYVQILSPISILI